MTEPTQADGIVQTSPFVPPATSHFPRYFFTFGVESPLAGRYVMLHGSVDGTRRVMNAVFNGRWSTQLPEPAFVQVQQRRSDQCKALYTELELGISLKEQSK
jgi:hypothetical protein